MELDLLGSIISTKECSTMKLTYEVNKIMQQTIKDIIDSKNTHKSKILNSLILQNTKK